MSRTVSYPPGSVAVCFRDVSCFGSGYTEDDSFDELSAELEWKSLIEDIVETCKSHWPSLRECEYWLDNENRVLLENQHAIVGISEYGGLACVWLRSNGIFNDALANHWSLQIAPKFNKFFGQLRKVGTFSNGEAVYEKI